MAFGFISHCSGCGGISPLLLQTVHVELLGHLHPQAAPQPAASVVRFHALFQSRFTEKCDE